MNVIAPPSVRRSVAEFPEWELGPRHWLGVPASVSERDLLLDGIGFRAPLAAFSRTTRLA